MTVRTVGSAWMNAGSIAQLNVLTDLVRQFGLTSLHLGLRACEALAGDESPLDVAVLGQFKSGKSSLLNTVLGEAVFPVGAVPVTAVITRATAVAVSISPVQKTGSGGVLHVTYQDGSVEEIPRGRIAEFVTEAGNPGNRRGVAVVDVLTPALRELPGVRLVDTPGLGSVLAHNSEATRTWMPNVAVALVTVGAERPLSDEDLRLVAEARRAAPRVVIVLTKVDLLTADDLAEVTAFLDRTLRQHFGDTVGVLPFSSRVEPERWANQLREAVLLPVVRDVDGERRAVLALKLTSLTQACHGYLAVGLQAARRADADQDRLRAAILNEAVNVEVIRDELQLAEQRVRSETRATFEKMFLAHQSSVQQQVVGALAAEAPTWAGNLAQQTQRYETWMAERLTAELTPLSREAVPLAADLLAQAEGRFRRIVEAFRDRLSRNIHEALGITVSPAAWEVKIPALTVVPVAVTRALMTNWELLWWLLPMWLVGGLFRRHIRGLVPWEVEKNLIRLAGDWAATVDAAVADLRARAVAWVDAELATLDRLLGPRSDRSSGCAEHSAQAAFHEALRRLEEAGGPLGNIGKGSVSCKSIAPR
jgi:GTP-binding protein EngB required for normal cell division